MDTGYGTWVGHWTGTSWEGPVNTAPCSYTLTLTPTVVVDGIVQELSQSTNGFCGGYGEFSLTWTRVGD